MTYYCFAEQELNLDIEVGVETHVYGSVDPQVIVVGVYGESGENLLRSEEPHLQAIAHKILREAESDSDWLDRVIRDVRGVA